MPNFPSWTRVDTEDEDLMEGVEGSAAEEREYFKSLYERRKKISSKKENGRNRFIKFASIIILALLLLINVYYHNHKGDNAPSIIFNFFKSTGTNDDEVETISLVKESETADVAMLWVEDNDDDGLLFEKHADKNPQRIERIAILSERNTEETDLIVNLMNCFPDLEVSTSLTRLGHWFQDPKIETGRPKPTIVITLFLNIYDWVDLMRNNPVGAPNHKNLTWNEFVNKPWTMERSEAQKKMESNEEKSDSCQWEFKHDEVIPCVASMDGSGDDDAVYELRRDKSGEPFNSIVSLRAEKIRNYLSTEKYSNVHKVIPVQYESLIVQGGLEYLMESLIEVTNIHPKCELSGKSLKPTHESKPSYEKMYIDWLDNNADWATEQLIGYKKGEMIKYNDVIIDESDRKYDISTNLNQKINEEIEDEFWSKASSNNDKSTNLNQKINEEIEDNDKSITSNEFNDESSLINQNKELPNEDELRLGPTDNSNTWSGENNDDDISSSINENEKDDFWSKASSYEDSISSNENNDESKDQLITRTQDKVNTWSSENKEMDPNLIMTENKKHWYDEHKSEYTKESQSMMDGQVSDSNKDEWFDETSSAENLEDSNKVVINHSDLWSNNEIESKHGQAKGATDISEAKNLRYDKTSSSENLEDNNKQSLVEKVSDSRSPGEENDESTQENDSESDLWSNEINELSNSQESMGKDQTESIIDKTESKSYIDESAQQTDSESDLWSYKYDELSKSYDQESLENYQTKSAIDTTESELINDDIWSEGFEENMNEENKQDEKDMAEEASNISKEGTPEGEKIIGAAIEDDIISEFSGDTIDSFVKTLDIAKPKVISLLAERNSGLEWLYPKIKDCFPDMEVTTTLTRQSPWFQSPRLNNQLDPTLVIALFINPYSWIDLMRINSVHAPNHINKDWFTFVSSAWTMDRPEEDTNTDCQYNFSYDEILPCAMTQTAFGDHPVYEMKCRDGKCEPYKNIVELRADKIRNFLSVEKWENVISFTAVLYESLTAENGFKYLISKIEKETDVTASCKEPALKSPIPPSKLSGGEKEEFRTWIQDNVDWDIEFDIGYESTMGEHIWG